MWWNVLKKRLVCQVHWSVEAINLDRAADRRMNGTAGMIPITYSGRGYANCRPMKIISGEVFQMANL